MKPSILKVYSGTESRCKALLHKLTEGEATGGLLAGYWRAIGGLPEGFMPISVYNFLAIIMVVHYMM